MATLLMENQKLIEWLKGDLEKLEKNVDEKFQAIDSKMDEMLKFKWQIMGGVVAGSSIMGIIIQIVSFLLGKHAN